MQISLLLNSWANLIPLASGGLILVCMRAETTRAGANPAEMKIPAPAYAEDLPAAAVKKFIGTAAVILEKNLFAATRLLASCEAHDCELESAAGRDAVKTTIRLLRTQSEAAAALARLARGETRHRVIVELHSDRDGLNSKNPTPSPQPSLAGPETAPSGSRNVPHADR